MNIYRLAAILLWLFFLVIYTLQYFSTGIDLFGIAKDVPMLLVLTYLLTRNGNGKPNGHENGKEFRG